MIAGLTSGRIALAAAILAFGAGWLANGWRLNAAHRAQLLAIQRQMQEQHNAIRASDQTIVAAYRHSIDGLRPARRLRVCPDVPAAATGGAGSATESAPDPGSGGDIAGTVAACLGELYRYRALSEALAGR